MRVGELALTSSASLGVSISPEHGRGGRELMQHADAAMYQAKSERRGFAFYEPASVAQLSLTDELTNLLTRPSPEPRD